MLDESTVKYSIAQQLKGHITINILIQANIGFLFKGNLEEMTKKEGVFIYLREGTIENPNFVIAYGFKDNKFFFYRNGYQLEYPITNLEKKDNEISIVIGVDPTQLYMFILDNEFRRAINAGSNLEDELFKRKKKIITPPTYPPNKLITWARERNIIPRILYDSHEDLFETVVDSLESIQSKVNMFGMVNPFWDITREGNKIVGRLPKSESDVQPTIKGLLSDIAIAKNLEIYPEHPIASGNLDFYFSGTLASGKSAGVCVELKNAHSSRLEDGLISQLPTYMKAKGCDYGVYCILYYKGEYFHEPSKYDRGLFEAHIKSLPLIKGLKVVHVCILDFSIPVQPSKIRS